MNNWDKKPTIKVICGADDVPQFAINAVLKDLMKDVKYWESSTIQHDDVNYEVINTDNLDDNHLLDAINSLHNRMTTSDIVDWIEYAGDTQLDIDELWVSLGMGTHYAHNCKVEVYYVSI